MPPMNVSAEPSPQAVRFFERLQAMDEPDQQSFRRIYALAPHRDKPVKQGYASVASESDSPSSARLHYPMAVGRHVRVAMVESLTHPAVAEWVRMNLALRIGLKLAQTTHQPVRAARLESVLEAFHVASDAFIHGFSLLQAQQVRLANEVPTLEKTLFPRENVVPWRDGKPVDARLAAELEGIAQFKRQVIPGLARAIRRQSG